MLAHLLRSVAAMDLTQKLLSSTLPADPDDGEAPPKDIALIAGLADDDLPVLTEHVLPGDPPDDLVAFFGGFFGRFRRFFGGSQIIRHHDVACDDLRGQIANFIL